MIRRPPRSTRTDTLFPYTTLFQEGFGMPQSRRPAGREMIDFSAPRGSPRLKLANSLSYDGVHIIRGALTPNEDGKIIGGSQLSIAIHVGDPLDLEWSEPGSDRLRVTDRKSTRLNSSH